MSGAATGVAVVAGAALTATVGYAAFMLVRFVRYHRHTGRPLPQPDAAALVRVASTEVGALVVAGWWHLRDPLVTHERLPPGPISGPPVLCVHGFLQNGTNFFALRRELADAGRITAAVALGRPGRRVAQYAHVVEAELDRMVQAHEGPIDVVCHSMGGLVLRAVLQARPDLRPRIGRVVTMGTPHEGTAATRGLHWLPEAKDMARRRGEWRDLHALDTLIDPGQVTTIATEDDVTVYPIETTRVRGARRVEIRGVGHAGLLTFPPGRRHVLEALGIRPPDPSADAPA